MDSNRESELHVDRLLDDFDDAWNRGQLPDIAKYLEQVEDSIQRELLIELIKIDLEYRWRSGHDTTATPRDEISWFPLLRDYQRCFPTLADGEKLPLELITEEYRVRHRWGDQPNKRIYLSQFGGEYTELSSKLLELDRELRQLDGDTGALAGQPALTGSLISPTAPEVASAADLQIGDEIDDFQLLNRLGSGSFAEVFLALQQSMQRLVALKVSQVRTHEPKVLSSLDHPNIVRVYDQRQVGERYLLMMQYVAGASLGQIAERLAETGSENRSGQSFLAVTAEILQDQGGLPMSEEPNTSLINMDWPTTVTWIAARLTSALQHAHQQGVLHRDVKPENILITAAGRPMLLDFNLSFGQAVIGANPRDFFGGSLAYMSPQQLEVLLGRRSPQDVDESSDFYSLAIVLWELLVGERPFADELEGEKSQAVMEHMLAQRRNGPSLAALPANCPGGLQEMLAEHLSATDSDYVSSTTGTVRRLHLALTPEIDRLLTPSTRSWASRWMRRPTTWLLVCGLLPNVLMSLLNIWANHRLILENFDEEFFRSTQQPVINTVNFTLGIVAGLWIYAPVIKAMWAQQMGIFDRLPDWEQIGKRALIGPGMLAAVILLLWIESGLAFPIWNQFSPASAVGTADTLIFLSSQVLHGLIASATTYVLLTAIAAQALFPRFLPEHEDRVGQRRLDHVGRQLSWATACLGLILPIALFILALSDSADTQVFMALAVVGFISYWITSMVTPTIRETLQRLRRTLASTSELVQIN
ncbi:MAG: serine/threonine-protein kinase [Bythopirellula sp.]